MKSSIESLESRRLFTVATADYVAIVTDEKNLPTIFSTATKEETMVRGALHSDLNMVHLFRGNTTPFVALARDEAADIQQMRKDVLTLDHTLDADARLLLVRGNDLRLYTKNVHVQAAFSTSLAKFQQDEVNLLQKLTNDATTASTGLAATELGVIAAIDPTDLTLQSDEQSGIANLAATATSLGDALDVITNDAATFVTDSSGVQVYGNEDLFGAGYPLKSNPYGGALVSGLAANVTSVATVKYVAPATFSPSAGDYPGTDQIYVGSDVVPAAGQLAGPQVITLDYSALTELAHPIKTFTLGIATDGFENPTINIPYTVSINGVPNAALTSVLNSLNDADRVEQFVSIGIDPAQLSPSKVLTISIDGPGDGISGWAVDFLTVGIQNG